MKDLVSRFSSTSERTLRSDVQKLITDGLVERLGVKVGHLAILKRLM